MDKNIHNSIVECLRIQLEMKEAQIDYYRKENDKLKIQNSKLLETILKGALNI